MTTNNFIALSQNDIIIYNHIQSKIYSNFISHHKKYNTIDNTNNNENYCKKFKYNVCLCCRNKDNLNNYPAIYNCPNKKRILYNLNNFNFLNPISININNNKLYPIDIFTYYRQEYLPFIINEEFNIYKNNQLKLNIINKRKLQKSFNILKSYQNNFNFLQYSFKLFKGINKKPLNVFNDYSKKKSFNILKSYQNNFHFLQYSFKLFKGINKKPLNVFNNYSKKKSFNILKSYQYNFNFLQYSFKLFKGINKKPLNTFNINYDNSYNNNSYYNDLLEIFNKKPLNTSKTIATQTDEPIINYALIIAIILNDYTNLIGDYNDLIKSLIKY